jgi:hypothetical protein
LQYSARDNHPRIAPLSSPRWEYGVLFVEVREVVLRVNRPNRALAVRRRVDHRFRREPRVDDSALVERRAEVSPDFLPADGAAEEGGVRAGGEGGWVGGREGGREGGRGGRERGRDGGTPMRDSA